MSDSNTVKFSSLFSDWKQFLNIPNGIAPLDNQRKLPLENLPDEYLNIIPKANNDYLGLVRPDNVTIQVDESGIISVLGNSSLIPDSVHFDNIVGKPHTLLQYGITDTYTKTEIDNLFPKFNEFYRKNEIDAKLPSLDYYYSKVDIDNIIFDIKEEYVSNEYINDHYYDKDYIDTIVFSKATLENIGLVKPDGVTTEIDDDGIISVTGSALTTDSVHWDNVTSKPSTVYGFGINDCYTKTEIDHLLPKYNIGNYYTKYEVNEFFLTKEEFISDFPSKATLEDTGMVMPDGITLTVDHNGILSVLHSSTGSTPDAIHWDKIIAKPTSLEGYNLTNVYTKTEIDSIFSTKEESAVQPASSNTLGIIKPDNQTTTVSQYGTISVLAHPDTNPLSVEFVEGNGGIKIDGYELSVNFGNTYDTVPRGDHTHDINDLTGNIPPDKLAKNSPTSSSFLRGDGYWYETKLKYSNGSGLILEDNKFSVDFGSSNNQVPRGDHTHNINTLDGKFNITILGDNDPSNTSYLRGDNTWVDVEDIIESIDPYRHNILSKNQDFTALNFYYYFLNTTNNEINVHLPAAPKDGDWFSIVDETESFAINKAIVISNGQYINNRKNNYFLTTNRSNIKFIFYSNSWHIVTLSLNLTGYEANLDYKSNINKPNGIAGLNSDSKINPSLLGYNDPSDNTVLQGDGKWILKSSIINQSKSKYISSSDIEYNANDGDIIYLTGINNIITLPQKPINNCKITVITTSNVTNNSINSNGNLVMGEDTNNTPFMLDVPNVTATFVFFEDYGAVGQWICI